MALERAFGPDVPVYEESQKTEEGRRWWAALPWVVADLELEWGFQTGLPFAGGGASWVAPARASDGTDAVLKVNLPHREAPGGGNGIGAVGRSGRRAPLPLRPRPHGTPD